MLFRSDGAFGDRTGEGAYEVGITGLCVLALLRSGAPADEPRVAKGLAFLRGREPTRTYELAIQALALCAAGADDDLPRIQRIVKLLEESQRTNGANCGGWTYGPNAPGVVADGSNTEFALWALDEAARRGARVRVQTWQDAAIYWTGRQNADGGCGYSDRAGAAKSTGGMTCAGAASLAICKQWLRPKGLVPEELGKALERALENLDTVFSPDDNPGQHDWFLFYAVGLRRVAELTHRRKFGEQDWRAAITEYLLKTQNAVTGYWREQQELSSALISTSLALWFLGETRAAR